MSGVSYLNKALLAIFHPIDCFDIIKRERGKFKPLPVLILYLSAVLVNYLYIFIVHFPLSGKKVTDANIALELAVVVVPLFTFSVASYAVTAIINGESRFTEMLTAHAYSLTPYIILTPLLGVVSNLISFEQAGVYFFFKYVSLLWVFLLIFLSIKYLNDYTVPQTLGIVVLSVIMTVIVWAVLLLLFSLTLQLFSFFTDLYHEFIYRL